MSKVKVQGNASGTGVFTVESPNSNTDRTLTLPDSAGTLLTSDGDGSNLTGISGGKVLQVIYSRTSTTVTKTITSNATSGDYVDTGLSATITPTTADSDILVMFTQNVQTERDQLDYPNDYDIKLYRDSGELTNTGTSVGYGNFMLYPIDSQTNKLKLTSILAFNYFDTSRSSGTAAITYKTKGTPYRPGSAKFNYQGSSTMTLMEIGV